MPVTKLMISVPAYGGTGAARRDDRTRQRLHLPRQLPAIPERQANPRCEV